MVIQSTPIFPKLEIIRRHWYQDMLDNPEFRGPFPLRITYTKVKYCNNILEQDHRRIKKITNPMLGFKSFNAACDTITGIETVAMLRKNQSLLSRFNEIKVSIREQIDLIAA